MRNSILSRRDVLERAAAAAGALALPAIVPGSVFGDNAPISHLSDLCIRLGRAIQWDPQKEQIVNDAEAARLLNRPLRTPWKLH